MNFEKMMKKIEMRLKDPNWGDGIEIRPDVVRVVDFKTGDCIEMPRGLWDALG